METTTFRCNGCGAPLPVKKKKGSVVTCEYCGTKNHVEGIEKDEPPVYSAPAKTGKELIGRFLDLRKDKQDSIMMNIVTAIIMGGIVLAIIVKVIMGGI